MDIRQEALLAVAYDYYNHRSEIQYDQRSMDRFVQITPRRRKFFPPEAATKQYTLHLDCSAFCFAVYYQALGLKLPYDITWHMYEHMEPLVYKYEKTFDETLEEKQKFAEEFTAALQPGDLITMLHQGQAGHIMIYVGEGKFMHCCPEKQGVDDSYNYAARTEGKNRNAILINDITDITEIVTGEEAGLLSGYKRYNMFSPKERVVAIHRPWLLADGVTEQAKIRLDGHKNLHSGVECSHWGGQQAAAGDVIEYRVKVKNLGDGPKSVTAEFIPPTGTSFGGEAVCEAEISGGGEKVFTFGVIAEQENAFLIEAPKVRVNGLNIPAQKVLQGPSMTEEEQNRLVGEVAARLEAGEEALAAASAVYKTFGIDLNPVKKTHIRRLFHHFDTCAREDNNILIRAEQEPLEDMAAYSLFGGKGIVTGDILKDPSQRTTEILPSDLMAGDIILCANDPYAHQTHALFYTGESLIGAAEQGLANRALAGEELDRFMRSLFGRFCFVILRPWLASEPK